VADATWTGAEIVALIAAGSYASPPTEDQMKGGVLRAEIWLAEHDAKVRAEALREAYADLEAYTDSGAPFGHRPVEEFLLHRADRIEQGKEQGS